ncbi:hypothetical protein Glove_50g134 [Diversispora epigaea]|uniref:Uncharacterized protein n=1 Tax=Diversispora epigaea TaxID=1348612 RepID=A0A397JKL5_9GLOM|nr:hypothetical protein Glove_50g134 [Diversispora epigaea]
MEENNLIKVLASNIVVLNLEEDLPQALLSVVLYVSIQVTVRTNIKEYLSEKETRAMSFHLYHYPEEKHLSKKIQFKMIKRVGTKATNHKCATPTTEIAKTILKTSPKARKCKSEPRANTTKPKALRFATIALKNTKRIMDEDPKEESSQQAEEVVNVD